MNSLPAVIDEPEPEPVKRGRGRPPKTEETQVQLTVRLPWSLREMLRDHSRVNDRSLNDEILYRCARYQETPVTATLTRLATVRRHLAQVREEYPTVTGVLIQPGRTVAGGVAVVYQHADEDVCDSGSLGGDDADAAAYLQDHADDVASARSSASRASAASRSTVGHRTTAAGAPSGRHRIASGLADQS